MFVMREQAGAVRGWVIVWRDVVAKAADGYTRMVQSATHIANRTCNIAPRRYAR